MIESEFKVRWGGNSFVNCSSLVSYGASVESLFRLYRCENLDLGIDFDVYDARGAKVATIRRSNIVDGDASAYELTHAATVKTVVERISGRCIVRIDKRPESSELDVNVSMYLPDGRLFEATADGTTFGPMLMTDCTFDGGIGIGIAVPKGTSSVRLG